MAKEKKRQTQPDVRVTVILPADLAAWALEQGKQQGLKLSPWIRVQLTAIRRAATGS